MAFGPESLSGTTKRHHSRGAAPESNHQRRHRAQSVIPERHITQWSTSIDWPRIEQVESNCAASATAVIPPRPNNNATFPATIRLCRSSK